MISPSICQIPNCTNSQFTHCPHCSMNTCFHCLQQHYHLVKQDYRKNLLDFDWQLNRNHQQMISREKDIFQRLLQTRMYQYDQIKNFVDEKFNFHTNTNMMNFQLTDSLEMKQKYMSMMNMHQQFFGLLNEITRLIVDFQTNRDGTCNTERISSADGQNEYNDNAAVVVLPVIQPEAPPTIEVYEDEPPLQTSLINNSEISPVVMDTNETIDSIVNSSVANDYSIQALKDMFFICPFTKYTLGLQKQRYKNFRVANIPCRNLRKRDICLYQHLLQHHAFNASVALDIIRVVISAPDHLDRIDLFSRQSVESIISNQVLSYIGHCPLHKAGVYGILPTHEVRLCIEHRSKNIPVHHHLRSYHKISYRYATRLVEAIMKKIHEKIPIIRPNDTVHRKS